MWTMCIFWKIVRAGICFLCESLLEPWNIQCPVMYLEEINLKELLDSCWWSCCLDNLFLGKTEKVFGCWCFVKCKGVDMPELSIQLYNHHNSISNLCAVYHERKVALARKKLLHPVTGRANDLIVYYPVMTALATPLSGTESVRKYTIRFR